MPSRGKKARKQRERQMEHLLHTPRNKCVKIPNCPALHVYNDKPRTRVRKHAHVHTRART